jgi:hypothetical protein
MDLKEIGWEDLDCISLAKYRDQQRGFVNTVMNILLSKYAGNLWTSYNNVSK